MPLLQLFLYSYALSFDVKNLPTATLDFDHTTQSRQYLDALQQSNYFTVNQTLRLLRRRSTRRSSPNTDKVVVVVGAGLRQRPRRRPRGQRADPRRRLRRRTPRSSRRATRRRCRASTAGKVVVSQVEAKGFSTRLGGLAQREHARLVQPRRQVRGLLRARAHRRARHDGARAADGQHARAGEGERAPTSSSSSRPSARSS